MENSPESPDFGTSKATSIVPGARIGQLTVLADSGRRKNGYIIWRCRCDCGNTLDVDKRTLQRGSVTHCGCSPLQNAHQKDITGQRFGRLTALHPTQQRGPNGSVIWHLKCDCGGTVDASVHQLTAGYRKSCGCLSHPPQKDWIGRRFGRLVVQTYAGKQKGKHFWTCLCDCGKQITVAQSNLKSGHSQSCGCIGAENLRQYLQLAHGTSVTQLERRLGKVDGNNTSGHTGVYFNARTQKWVAQLRFQGKAYYLGAYQDKNAAIAARKTAEGMLLDFLQQYYVKDKQAQP